MKKLVLILFLVLAGPAVHSQSFTPPAEGKAAVYFIRISGLGSLVDFFYFDSARYIGKFYGNKYMRYECEPGRHLFWAKAENRDYVEADLEPGRIYLLEPLPQMGAMKAGVSLQRIDMSDEKINKKVMKILAKPEVKFTDEELAARAAKLTDVIEKGLERYREEKAKGKEMLKLEKQMFYQPPGQP
jgi:hypothetical protein